MSQDESADALAAAVDRVLNSGDFTDADLTQMRAGLDAFADLVSVTEPVHRVEESLLDLPGRRIRLRTYRPDPVGSATLVWFHGGGYVSGTLDAIDPVCRVLANRTGVTVVSVDYRLAPEHPYPAALDDCLAALDAVAATAEGSLAIGGDSAGGGLAAAVARRTSVRLSAQLLLCPWLDVSLSCPSVRAKGTDHGLTEASLRGFARMYLGGDGDPADPGASPLLGEDVTGLPATIVVTAENDPLCDEGERYAERIVAAGGRARVRRWDAMVHGFVGMTAELVEAEEALTWSCDQLRLELTPPVA